jgi:mannose-6-phosphate isomerase-like protein (cupin superfamily)
MHYHPAQDEHFEVESGKMLFVVDGFAQVVGAGDTIDIPRSAPHQARNASDAEAAVGVPRLTSTSAPAPPSPGRQRGP